MMVRPLVTAMIALGLVGCGKQLNPEYCAAHPNDTDCRGADLVVVDAPQGCMSNAMCTEDPAKKVCEIATGNCVQCVPGGDTSACTTDIGTKCGQDRQCHGCLVDTDCPSVVCLPDGKCAAETDVLYASPAGGGNCSKSTPCKLDEAVAMLSTVKTIIKMTTTFSGPDYMVPPITIDKPALIIGTATTLTPAGDGPAITVDTAAVEIMGLTVTGATTDAIACSNGTLTLRRATLSNNAGFGLHTTGCDVTLERTRVRKNIGGGLYLDTGKLEVRNNIVDYNGDGTVTNGNVFLNKATGRLVFNTIANNNSANGGGGKTGGIKCAGSGMFLVAHNIIVANGQATDQTVGDCQYGTTNYESTSISAVSFKNPTATIPDYHLTAQSPTTNPIIRDDPDADADCKVNGAYIDDFDGEARPYQLCDRGADEYRP